MRTIHSTPIRGKPEGGREVTQDEFFKAIGPLDVHPCPVGPYPYTSVFRTQLGVEHGRIVSEYEHPELGCGLTKDRYYLTGGR